MRAPCCSDRRAWRLPCPSGCKRTTNPVDRWLEFIREQPQTRLQVLDMSHTIAIPVEGGYIQDVPTVSARACIACSADEV